MSAGHTPGPWRVEDGTTLIWGACNPDDRSTHGMGYPITECRTSPASSSAWCKGPGIDEGEANARLIAAAPEMVEALAPFAKIVRDIITNHDDGDVIEGGIAPDRITWGDLRRAASAFAKATGQ